MSVSDFPALNASLNAASALCLITGYVFIRQRRREAHKIAMLAACVISTLFLACYLVYHFQVGSVRFPGVGAIRSLYLGILLTHTVLAAAVPVLVVITLRRIFAGRTCAHRRIARWTLPIWLYVSVTGVIVYWMLYRLY